MSSTSRHLQSTRWLAWVAVAAILGVAALLRLWALARPESLVFDELYYVRDAVSQLVHGFPTTWPDDEPEFGGERARAFSDVASTIAHPPLGKWLIGLGILVLGPDSGWGWRIAVALAGVATVGVTMLLGWLLTRSRWVAWLAGLLLAVDGVHVVLSRVALLDGFLTMFVTLGALFVVLDQRAVSAWRRPWLLAAGLAFGAAAAVKWSGLFALAAFLVCITVSDLLRKLRDKDRRAWSHCIARGLMTAVLALTAAGVSYVASWSGWIITSGGQGRASGEAWWVSLWKWHTNMASWHVTLDAPHPYQAHPLGWPLALRPTSMYRESADGWVAVISPLPNPLVTWGGVAALLLLLWVVARALVVAGRTRTWASLDRITWVCAFVLTGYLSGWLPWVATFSRSAVFQFYAVVMTPFAALALALVLAWFASLGTAPPARINLDRSPESVQGRRISMAIFVGVALILAMLFWPVWSGAQVADWFYALHRWLPTWS